MEQILSSKSSSSFETFDIFSSPESVPFHLKCYQVNPIARRKAKIVCNFGYNFGLSECNIGLKKAFEDEQTTLSLRENLRVYGIHCIFRWSLSQCSRLYMEATAILCGAVCYHITDYSTVSTKQQETTKKLFFKRRANSPSQNDTRSIYQLR